MNAKDVKARRTAPLQTPTSLGANATKDISAALTTLLSDVYTLYLKTKNFHWHMSGPHFRDYHLLLDEQASQIFAMTDPIAERVRKLGGMTLHSIGHIAKLQRVKDNDAGQPNAQRTQVRFGRSSVNTIEVLDGLKPGDQVVLSDMSAWDAHDRVRLN